MIVPSFRAIAALLILAGGCLGFLAGNLMAGRPVTPVHRGDPKIEAQVEHYRSQYSLNPTDTDRIRHELQTMRQAIQDKAPGVANTPSGRVRRSGDQGQQAHRSHPQWADEGNLAAAR